MEVPNIDKHASLLRYGKNYDIKIVIVQGSYSQHFTFFVTYEWAK